MAKLIDRDQFIAMLTERFPEIAALIHECCQGLLHPEMGTFARATQSAIDSQDHNTISQHFNFVDEIYSQAAPDVENAVNVSYLENLSFIGSADRIKARELLTPRLQQALIELEDYLERLFKASHLQ